MDPAGMLIGRSSGCAIRLDDPKVSREHARIFRDPFGRWIVEDTGSRHGVLVGKQRVTAHAILPGERLEIGPFTLQLLEEPEVLIGADTTSDGTSVSFAEDAGSEVTVSEAVPGRLSSHLLAQFNGIAAQFGALSSSSDLYRTACGGLADFKEAVAAVVRLPRESGAVAISPEVLSYHFGGGRGQQDARGASQVHLSRRALEAARASGGAVMATNVSLSPADIGLTVPDARHPRAVFCTIISGGPETLDLLYLDIPADESAEDVFELFQAVARHAESVGHMLRLADERAERQVLDRELAGAREIQNALTPTALIDVVGVDVASHYEPAMWVGGDYCDLWLTKDRQLAFAVGDVMGHGIAAAMVMSSMHAGIRVAMSLAGGGLEAMEHVSRYLGEAMPDGMFATLFLGMLDIGNGDLEYVNAGHPPPLLVSANGDVQSLEEPRNSPLGIARGPFVTGRACLEPNAGVVVVTDGLLESRSPRDELFDMARLEQILGSGAHASARQLVQVIADAAREFRQSAPCMDDVTVLALFRRGPSTDPT